jgi:dihydrofolate reductase
MTDVKFILIAAVSTDGVIGVDNEIPWRIPEDFKHFRNTTMGNMLLVGYNTYKTLPEKAFEGREYMVVHGDNPIEYDKNPDIYHFRDLDSITYLLEDEKTDIEKVYVIGGAMVYNTMIDRCDEAIITWVNIGIPNGNKYFPINKLFAYFEVVEDQDWQMSKTGIEYRVVRYRRKK